MSRTEATMRILRTFGLVAAAAATFGCATAHVVSTKRIADVTIDGADPEAVSRTCVAVSQAFGWRVEHADRSVVVVETPRVPTSGARDAPHTWSVVTIALSPAGAGGCALSCSTSTLADGDVGPAQTDAFDDLVRDIVKAVGARAGDDVPR
jgi:hypothetical protein